MLRFCNRNINVDESRLTERIFTWIIINVKIGVCKLNKSYIPLAFNTFIILFQKRNIFICYLNIYTLLPSHIS